MLDSAIHMYDLPVNKDGKIDKEKLSIICQVCVNDIYYLNDSKTIIGVVTTPEIEFDQFCDIICKYIKLSKVNKEEYKPKAYYPIYEPFAPNKCPKCGALMGGKLIDNCVYENPYFDKCPECGLPLKKFSWQK